MNRWEMQALLTLLVAAVAGCGSANQWKNVRPETAPASGIVTFEGEPLEGAIIVFQPTTPGGIGASAVTNDEGKFELRTFPPELGAVPGKYSVYVTKTDVTELADGAEDANDPPPNQAISLIPERYGLPTSSELVAEIPQEGTDELVFNLTN